MAATTAANTTPMGHDSHSPAGDATESAPFDAQFIDSMILHHQGAVEMAKQAQTEAQRPEIKQLADAIIKSQTAEIERMQTWRKAWYPDLPVTGGMSMSMGAMAVSTDTATAYDLRFIDAMVPHHESAISMAQEALSKAEHAELKTLANEIIAAQTREIDQMKQWRAAWSA